MYSATRNFGIGLLQPWPYGECRRYFPRMSLSREDLATCQFCPQQQHPRNFGNKEANFMNSTRIRLKEKNGRPLIPSLDENKAWLRRHYKVTQ